LILGFIDPFSFPPISRAEDADYAASVGKSDCNHTLAHATDAVEPAFGTTVAGILGDDTAWIEESALGNLERNTMLCDVLAVLCVVPFKTGSLHVLIVHRDLRK